MPNTILDKFRAEFISGVRNEATDEWSLILHGKVKDAKAQSIFRGLDSLPSSCREFVEKYFHEVIDSTVFQTMNFFEQAQDDIKLLVKSDSGEFVDIVVESDGLAGELFGENGWIAKYGDGGRR